MRKISVVLFCLLAAALFLAAQPPCPSCKDFRSNCLPAPEADPLTALQAGNARFTLTRGGPRHPRQSLDCAKKQRCCQKPFAIVLSCADSRVPPEVIFDQGIGDLFVARVAGNVTAPDVLGSIEYAVDHFEAYTIVVLGHQRCGAVAAAFGERPGPHIDVIWDLIRSAIPAMPKALAEPTPEQWDQAVRQNVRNMVENLEKDLRAHKKVKLNIQGAYYSLDTGRVELPIK